MSLNWMHSLEESHLQSTSTHTDCPLTRSRALWIFSRSLCRLERISWPTCSARQKQSAVRGGTQYLKDQWAEDSTSLVFPQASSRSLVPCAPLASDPICPLSNKALCMLSLSKFWRRALTEWQAAGKQGGRKFKLLLWFSQWGGEKKNKSKWRLDGHDVLTNKMEALRLSAEVQGGPMQYSLDTQFKTPPVSWRCKHINVPLQNILLETPDKLVGWSLSSFFSFLFPGLSPELNK